MKNHFAFLAIISLAASILSGCVTMNPSGGLQGPVYNERAAGQLNPNEYATVLDARPVIIQGYKSSMGTYAGAGVGAVLGGLLGSKVGQGNGKTAATVIGAAAGGAAGSSAGDAATTKMNQLQGVEVVIKRQDGKVQSVIQEATSSEVFRVNQLVRVIQTAGGWHVSPL